MKNNFGNNLPIINLYKKKDFKSKIDTQLLYGDNFKVKKKLKNFLKIKIKKDGYVGFIKNKNYCDPIKEKSHELDKDTKSFLKPEGHGVRKFVWANTPKILG